MQMTMRHRILSTLLCIAATASAQDTGVVSGVVRDTARRPVRDVELVVTGTTIAARSDSLGAFRITSVPPGAHELRVRRMGIMPFTMSVNVAAGDNAPLDIIVASSGVELPTVEVAMRSKYEGIGQVGGSDFYERARMGQGEFFTRERIDSIRPNRLYDLMRKVRGIGVVWGRDRKVKIVSKRGMSSINIPCEVALYFDGTRVNQDFLADISVEELEAVEAYSGPGTTPMQFGGSTASCGAVAFWMKHSR